jgi:broad specificity phosphatase PhoE
VDAELTEHGINQCKNLSIFTEKLDIGLDSELLVVSPMRRTLQTATHSFPSLIGKVKWLALEHLREQTGSHPCDRRLKIRYK